MAEFHINNIIGKVCNIEKNLANRNIKVKSLIPIGECAKIGNVDNKFCEIYTKKLFVDNTIHFGNDISLSANKDGTLYITNGNIIGDIKSTKYTYLQEGDSIQKFNGKILKLDIPLYNKKGFGFEIIKKDSELVFKSSRQKILIKINIQYRWIDIEYPPRFMFNVLVNNEVKIIRNLGIADYIDGNYLFLNAILDINNNDTITFLLSCYEDVCIEIINNSYIIIKTF